ncbi:mucin-12-like [Pollicipes pollicipes]|uniref:mucin-12-like n=1 Tax=Pollicipes pollicipes TaxID=41117 RepID=UPI00188586D7|nr:mucin-12-like [Pollicipes pollicipes]
MLPSSESPSVMEATTAHLPEGSEETIATSASVEKNVTNASIAYASTHAESTTHPPRSRQTAHPPSTQERSRSTEKPFAPTGSSQSHPVTQPASPEIPSVTTAHLRSTTSEQTFAPATKPTEQGPHVPQGLASTQAESTTHPPVSQRSAGTASIKEEQVTEGYSIPPSSESPYVEESTTAFHSETSRQTTSLAAEATEHVLNASQTYTSRRAEDTTHLPPPQQTTHVAITHEQSLATEKQSVPASSQSPSGIETTTVTHTERSEETTSPPIQATERALGASTAHSSTRSESTAHPSRPAAHTDSTQEQSPATEGPLLRTSLAHTLSSSQRASSGSPSGINLVTSTPLQPETPEQTPETATKVTEHVSHASKAHTSTQTAGASHPSVSHESVSTPKESLATEEHAMLPSSESPSVMEATTAHLPEGSEETIATSASVEKNVTNASIAYASTHAESTTHPPRSRQTAHQPSTQERSRSTEKPFAPTGSSQSHPVTQPASPEIPSVTTAHLRSTTSEQTFAPATKPTEQGPHVPQGLASTQAESTMHPPVSQRSAGTASIKEEQVTEGYSIPPSSESPYVEESATAFHSETSRQTTSLAGEATEHVLNASQTYASRRAEDTTRLPPPQQTTHVVITHEQSLATEKQSAPASSQSPSGIETTTVTHTERSEETTSPLIQATERALGGSTAHSSTRAESTAHPSRQAAHTASTQEQSPATEGPLLRTSLAHALPSSQHTSSGSPSGIKHLTSTSLQPEASEQANVTVTEATKHASKAHTSTATAGTSHPSLSHQSVSTLKESLATDEHAMLSSSESHSVMKATTAHLPKGSEETIATSTSVEKDVTDASIAYASTRTESTSHPPRSRQTAHPSSRHEQSLSTEEHFAPAGSSQSHPVVTQPASPEISFVTTAHLRSTTSEQTFTPATKPTEQGPHVPQGLTGTHAESTTHPPVSQRSAGTASIREEQATVGFSIPPSSVSPYVEEAVTTSRTESPQETTSFTAETREHALNASRTHTSRHAEDITRPPSSRQTTHVTTIQEQSLATEEQSVPASSQRPSGVETTLVTHTEEPEETASPPTQGTERALNASAIHARTHSTAHPTGSRETAHTDSTHDQRPATEGESLPTSFAHAHLSSQHASPGSPPGITHLTSSSLQPEISQQKTTTVTEATEHASYHSKSYTSTHAAGPTRPLVSQQSPGTVSMPEERLTSTKHPMPTSLESSSFTETATVPHSKSSEQTSAPSTTAPDRAYNASTAYTASHLQSTAHSPASRRTVHLTSAKEQTLSTGKYSAPTLSETSFDIETTIVLRPRSSHEMTASSTGTRPVTITSTTQFSTHTESTTQKSASRQPTYVPSTKQPSLVTEEHLVPTSFSHTHPTTQLASSEIPASIENMTTKAVHPASSEQITAAATETTDHASHVSEGHTGTRAESTTQLPVSRQSARTAGTRQTVVHATVAVDHASNASVASTQAETTVHLPVSRQKAYMASTQEESLGPEGHSASTTFQSYHPATQSTLSGSPASIGSIATAPMHAATSELTNPPAEETTKPLSHASRTRTNAQGEITTQHHVSEQSASTAFLPAGSIGTREHHVPPSSERPIITESVTVFHPGSPQESTVTSTEAAELATDFSVRYTSTHVESTIHSAASRQTAHATSTQGKIQLVSGQTISTAGIPAENMTTEEYSETPTSERPSVTGVATEIHPKGSKRTATASTEAAEQATNASITFTSTLAEGTAYPAVSQQAAHTASTQEQSLATEGHSLPSSHPHTYQATQHASSESSGGIGSATAATLHAKTSEQTVPPTAGTTERASHASETSTGAQAKSTTQHLVLRPSASTVSIPEASVGTEEHSVPPSSERPPVTAAVTEVHPKSSKEPIVTSAEIAEPSQTASTAHASKLTESTAHQATSRQTAHTTSTQGQVQETEGPYLGSSFPQTWQETQRTSSESPAGVRNTTVAIIHAATSEQPMVSSMEITDLPSHTSTNRTSARAESTTQQPVSGQSATTASMPEESMETEEYSITTSSERPAVTEAVTAIHPKSSVGTPDTSKEAAEKVANASTSSARTHAKTTTHPATSRQTIHMHSTQEQSLATEGPSVTTSFMGAHSGTQRASTGSQFVVDNETATVLHPASSSKASEEGTETPRHVFPASKTHVTTHQESTSHPAVPEQTITTPGTPREHLVTKEQPAPPSSARPLATETTSALQWESSERTITTTTEATKCASHIAVAYASTRPESKTHAPVSRQTAQAASTQETSSATESHLVHPSLPDTHPKTHPDYGQTKSESTQGFEEVSSTQGTERSTSSTEHPACKWDNITSSRPGTIIRDPSRCLHVECVQTIHGSFVDVTIVHEARGCCEMNGNTMVPTGFVRFTPLGKKKRCFFGRWHTQYFDPALNLTDTKKYSFKNKTYHFFSKVMPIHEALEICEKINGTLAIPENRMEELELGQLGAEGFGASATFWLNKEKIRKEFMRENDEEEPEKFIVYPHKSVKKMDLYYAHPKSPYIIESSLEDIEITSVPICEVGGRRETVEDYFNHLVSIGTMSEQGLPKEAIASGTKYRQGNEALTKMHEWRLPPVPRKYKAGHSNIGAELTHWGKVHEDMQQAIRNNKRFHDPLPIYKENHFNYK